METKVLTRLGKSMAILAISSLTTHAIQAQSLVRGQVTDTKGEPLMGATIKVKNSQEGAITDLDGKFSFESKGPPGGEICRFQDTRNRIFQ